MILRVYQVNEYIELLHELNIHEKTFLKELLNSKLDEDLLIGDFIEILNKEKVKEV